MFKKIILYFPSIRPVRLKKRDVILSTNELRAVRKDNRKDLTVYVGALTELLRYSMPLPILLRLQVL